MRLSRTIFFSLLMASVTTLSCRTKDKNTDLPPARKIIVDESFAPVIDDQLTVFRSSYPDRIELIYKPEIQAVNLFLSDTAAVAILSRELTAKEKKHFESKKIKIRVTRFAIDAVALIAHNTAPDTAVLVEDIIKVMKGEKGAIKFLVFDNANSSTVRYLKDLSQVKTLPSEGVYALNSNEEVIKYVVEHPGTIGVVGMNWIEQPESESEPFVQQTKFLGVKNLPGKPGSDQFYKPSQTTLALETYPLLRSLFIIDCAGGIGFASFIAGERGQRIVLKSGLLPDSIPPREIMIRKTGIK